jgi:hypothetical protein
VLVDEDIELQRRCGLGAQDKSYWQCLSHPHSFCCVNQYEAV